MYIMAPGSIAIWAMKHKDETQISSVVLTSIKLKSRHYLLSYASQALAFLSISNNQVITFRSKYQVITFRSKSKT